jgi:serine/threonine-protein kinase RsbW
MSEPVTGAQDVVEMSVPADGAFVAVLRTVAAGLASRCDLTLDEIEDLRIAVDEACSLLLPHAAAGSPLGARFTLAAGELGIQASVAAADDAEPDRDGFAWTVLDALAQNVDVASREGRLAITLTKRREDTSRGDVAS